MSLTRRRIDVTVTLGRGNFGEDGQDTVTLKGLRVSATIQKFGMPGLDMANVRIYGATPNFMNKVTRLGKPLTEVRDNTLVITAGDDESGMSQVFSGVINTAYTDFGGAPETSINLSAVGGIKALAKPVAPISFQGGVSAATVCQQIAASMGLGFKNSGVNVQLNNVYLPGTALDQLRKLKTSANCNIDPASGPTGQVVEMWPLDGKKGDLAPLLSAESGLVGYPRYSDTGVAVTALYRPGFLFGAQFNLKTELEAANGAWIIRGLTYDLESETPGGSWFCDIDAYRPTDANVGAS